MFLHSLSSFLCKHCICGHKCDYSIVDMPSLRSARYICLAANSICFRYAQARYDIDPRSRSEHIECVSTYRTRQRISKIRVSGFISTRTCSTAGTPNVAFFFFERLSAMLGKKRSAQSAQTIKEKHYERRKRGYQYNGDPTCSDNAFRIGKP